jgi:hypothetical protein
MKVVKRHRPASVPYLTRATDKLLVDVPDRILSVAAIEDRGLADGLAVIELFWRERVASGRISRVEMESSIVPVAALLSALLSGYLRGTPIGERAAAFDRLVELADGVLAGTPDRILIAGGIS